MLLKQLLQQTSAARNILFRDPFAAIEPEDLVREVIGLANIEFEGARYLVFGVNKGTMEGSGIVGIAEDRMADLKKAHRLISSLVKPLVQLAFIYDKIDGKLVGALEVDGCDEAPYAVRRDYSSKLLGGHSWVRDGRQFRDAEPADLDAIRERVGHTQKWAVTVGFGDQPDCDTLELDIPDTSNPPSRQQRQEIRKTLDWKKATKKTLGTINTHIFRLLHVRDHGADAKFDARDEKALVEQLKMAGESSAEADDYYYFEEKAVKLDLTLRNDDEEALEDAQLSLAFPRLKGFVVVTELHSGPGNGASAGGDDGTDYPAVQRHEKGSIATVELGTIASGASTSVFDCALRLAVGSAMQGKKVAINYTLKAGNKQSTGQGRLKIEFGQVISDEVESDDDSTVPTAAAAPPAAGEQATEAPPESESAPPLGEQESPEPEPVAAAE